MPRTEIQEVEFSDLIGRKILNIQTDRYTFEIIIEGDYTLEVDRIKWKMTAYKECITEGSIKLGGSK